MYRRHQREALVHPGEHAVEGAGAGDGGLGGRGHRQAPFVSSPITTTAVAGVAVRRDGQVGRGGRALEDARGQVEARVVARAVVAARPVGAHVGGGADLLLEGGRAAQVGAHALDDEEFGLDRALRALHVVGLLRRPSTPGSASNAAFCASRLDHLGGAAQHPHGLAAPLQRDLLAGLELGDVGLDRRAGGERPGAREPAHQRAARRRRPAMAAPAAEVATSSSRRRFSSTLSRTMAVIGSGSARKRGENGRDRV